MKKYYPPIRSLHLYFGLFISPFILIFSISVLVLNHPDIFGQPISNEQSIESRTKLDKIPYGDTDLETAKAIIEKLDIIGEIDFISNNERTFSFPVNKPGLRTNIRIYKETDSVFITQQYVGSLQATAYLHAMPGPHNVNIRGNSSFLKVWRLLADSVVYILLFLTASGIFLWYYLKAERVAGYYALVLGIAFFTLTLGLIFL